MNKEGSNLRDSMKEGIAKHYKNRLDEAHSRKDRKRKQKKKEKR